MTRITPDVRAQIGDQLADALDLPTIDQRAAAILAMHPQPEPAFRFPVGPITNLRVETDRQRDERLRRER